MMNKTTSESSLKFPSIGISRLRVISDGDGITTLVAGYGCPLRCKYCLNPQCFERSAPYHIYSLQELLKTVKIDDLYFQATGGGVVFGGGEPLLQPDFIHEFRSMAPASWQFILETSLNVDRQAVEKVIGDIDYYIIDIKDMNPSIYQAYTGKDNRHVLENLNYLINHVSPDKIRIRIPLIEGFNTNEDRSNSEKLLKEMGFLNFDFFTYNLPKALDKRVKDSNSPQS